MWISRYLAYNIAGDRQSTIQPSSLKFQIGIDSGQNACIGQCLVGSSARDLRDSAHMDPPHLS